MRARRVLFAALLAMPLAARGAIAQAVPRPVARPAAPAPALVAAPAGDTLVDVTGGVFDSTAGAPLIEAAVQLLSIADARRVYSATTDSAGAFRIARVPAGRYYATFVHPSLDVLGIEPPVQVLVVAPRSPVSLSIAGPRRMFGALCPNAPASDSIGALAGRVYGADDDVGIGGAKVVVTWTELGFGVGGMRPVLRRIPIATRADGGFLLCNVPSNADVELSAEAPRRRGGVVDGSVPFRGLRRQDLALGDSASAIATVRTVTDSLGRPRDAETLLRGTARVTGTVVTTTGQPVNGARLLVSGTAVTGATDVDGRFALSGLPAGTYSLEARAIGFEPRAVAVTLASGRVSRARIVMDTRVQTLASVRVYGKQTRHSRDIDGFLERRERGFGHYYTAADIERTHPLDMSSLLRTAPGLHVVPTGGVGYAIRGRGDCRPAVVVDGMPIGDGDGDIDQFVKPDQVAGVEVYNDGIGVPVQYSSNGCGAVLIWTRR